MDDAAQRARMLRALGAVDVAAPGGEFPAIFENAYVDSLDIEGVTPTLQCDADEVNRLRLVKGTVLTIPGQPSPLKIRRFEPDGTGMTLIRLGS